MSVLSDHSQPTPAEHLVPAADLMIELPVLAPGDTVIQARELLHGAPSGLTHLAVCDEGRLVGFIEVAALFDAGASSRLGDLARPPLASVATGALAERAAWMAAHAQAPIIAVHDDQERFAGAIPAYRLLPLLVHEHEMDLARIGGFLRGTRRARTASEEPVIRRVWHRAPWLLVGLAGAVVAAQIVRAFESELQGTLALAFFLPGIVYMADAVGTQTETLVIRGLSIGVSTRQILRLELLTGAFVGLLLSLAVFPFALLLTGDISVSIVVAVSLFASAGCATVVAMSLPWILQHFDLDPAFGSGPLATVIQDLLSIVIYFSISLLLVD